MATIKLNDTARENLTLANSYDPDVVEASLNDGEYGDLMDYDTADKVRDATLDEALESLESSPTGAFRRGDKTYYVAW